MKSTPKPRIARYYGMVSTATRINETWLEAEEICYPSGAMIRRCRAICEDGKLRVVLCGIADTYFSIPARARINGKSMRGMVSSDETGFTFTAYTI